MRVSFDRLRVARRWDTHEEIVTREINRRLAFVVRHWMLLILQVKNSMLVFETRGTRAALPLMLRGQFFP